MRKPLHQAAVAMLAAALLISALALAAGPASAASFAACSGGYNPDGSKGTFYHLIKAKRTSCTAARKVVRRWILDHADGTDNPTTAVKVLGYTCRGRAVSSPGDPNGGLSVLCVKGRQAISFYGHP